MRRPLHPGAVLALIAVAAIAPSAGAGGFLTLVLGPDGVVYSWKTGDPGLSPLPPSLARLAGRPINDLAVSQDGGKVVVLPAAPPAIGGRRKRIEGSAVVISSPTTAAPPAILNQIPFEGDGRRVAVSPDGRFAYVLAILAGPGPATGEVRSRLSVLDLDEGRVLSSTQLDKPPSAIAIDPGGSRLYLAYAGRIQTYTTRPLAQSWHYRSPGANRGLGFAPHGTVLYATRLAQVALFDPAVIASRKPEERQSLQDDATGVVPLPFSADSLLFSRDGLLAAVSGPGNALAFFEPRSGVIVPSKIERPEGGMQEEVRPFYFKTSPAELVVAIFPSGGVRTIPAPATPVEIAADNLPEISGMNAHIRSAESSTPGKTAAAPATSAPPTAAPTVTPFPAIPVPTPMAATAPTPSATPAPSPTPAPTPSEPSAPGPVLAGRLTGQIEAVKVIVIYGPGSIVREQARAVPDAGGAWRIPLPSPGSYRIVPLGEGSRPIRSEPNFHTLEVKDQGVSGLDFRILGTS